MPKHSKKGRRNLVRHTFTDDIGDVTLNDFANTVGHACRLNKPASYAIVREVKELCGHPTSDDTDWYDKDINNFDVEDSVNLSKSKNRCRKKFTEDTDVDVGNEYPLDVWFLLSEYIRPEDVTTFACICQNALHAVNSIKFWLQLYKRYYSPAIKVPERLTPECMERPRGLKACVIRTLFYVYPPFIERIKTAVPFENEPHYLVPSYCILAWHKKQQKVWDFNFKFQKRRNQLNKGTTRTTKHPDLLEMLEDIDANDELDCRVLQVTCMNFVSAPAVMGMYLTSVNLSVGHRMHHRLRLIFSNTLYDNTTRNHKDGNVNITFDPVSNIKVFNWWHPQYPYT